MTLDIGDDRPTVLLIIQPISWSSALVCEFIVLLRVTFQFTDNFGGIDDLFRLWEAGSAENINGGCRSFFRHRACCLFNLGFQLTNCGLRSSEIDQRILLESVKLVALHYLVYFCFIRDLSPRIAPLLYLANLTCLLHKSERARNK